MSDKHKIGLAGIVGVLLGASAATLGSQDRLSVAPDTKVLLENEHVRVEYHDVAVGQTIPFHSHPACVVYALKPFKVRMKLPDGTERILQGEAGEAFWTEPTTHAVENIGESDIHNLVVELRKVTSGTGPSR